MRAGSADANAQLGFPMTGIGLFNGGDQPTAQGSYKTTDKYFASPTVTGFVTVENNEIDMFSDAALRAYVTEKLDGSGNPDPNGIMRGFPLYERTCIVKDPVSQLNYVFTCNAWHVSQYEAATGLGNKPFYGNAWRQYWAQGSVVTNPENWVEGYPYSNYPAATLTTLDGPFSIFTQAIECTLIGDAGHPSAKAIFKNNVIKNTNRGGSVINDVSGEVEYSENNVSFADFVGLRGNFGYTTVAGEGTSGNDKFYADLPDANGYPITSGSLKIRKNSDGLTYGAQLEAVDGDHLVNGDYFTVKRYTVNQNSRTFCW
jgi:hypothetical protein